MGGPRWALAAALGPTGVAPAQLSGLISGRCKPCLLPKGGVECGDKHHIGLIGIIRWFTGFILGSLASSSDRAHRLGCIGLVPYHMARSSLDFVLSVCIG